MEISSQQKFRDDHNSNFRSFGSNYHPCSQSRKISIGVITDSVAEKICKTTKEVEASEKVTFSKQNSVGYRSIGEGVRATVMQKQTESPEQETSPWVFTRSLNQNTPTLETVPSAKQTSSLPTTSGMHNKFNGGNAAATEHSVQFLANQMPVFQSADLKQKKVDSATYRNKGGKDVSVDRVKALSFAARDEVLVPEKEVVENTISRTENRGMESLRMKLWEILGTASPPKKKISDSQVPDDGADNLHVEQRSKQEGNPVAQPRQNSDTIESDTQSPDKTLRRPVTRSLARKRAPNKVQLNKIKHVPSSSYKQKQPEKNIFAFEQGRSGGLHVGFNSGSSLSKSKKSERKRSRTEPRKICFPEEDKSYDIQQATDRSKTAIHAEKTSSIGHKTGSFHSCPSKNNREFVEPENVVQKIDSYRSSVMKMTDQLSDISSPALPVHGKRLEEFAIPSSKNIEDVQSDIQSPTFGTRTPIISSSPGSSPRIIKRELNDHCHAERVFNMADIHSSKSYVTSKSDYYKTNAETDSSDDGWKVENSPAMKSVPLMEKKDAQNGLLPSSSDEGDSDSSEESSPITEGCREADSLFPEVGADVRPEFIFRPTKRLRSQEGIKFNGFIATPVSPKGPEENNGSHGHSEEDQEDGLASAVLLFASALERVKSKMESVSRKKSAEILMSVAEEIHLQLQTAECQIQSDVVKLTTLSKSKRKRIESRFQEQREQLSLIHEKLKEEVNQHIQDCRSTIEGLEAHRIEFKGTVEKQRQSHRKVLLQAEAAIETQLNDAQGRITAVHKMAKEKLFQLKYVIADCLKEGILS